MINSTINIFIASILIIFCFVDLNMAHTVQNWSKNTATNQLHCPVPNEHILRCLNEWICQSVIGLDLRCLLNVNGQPLLKSLMNTLNGLGDNGSNFPLLGPALDRLT